MHQPTPGLPEFDYVRPSSLAEATRFLSEHADEARPFLGGTDTFIRLRDGVWNDKYLVDVKNLEGMNEISFDHLGGLSIGAAVSMNGVTNNQLVQEHYPLLVQAAGTVASYQLRSRATIVGNICNASPAGDTIGACMVHRGVLRVHGLQGFREEPLTDFFQGPGHTRLTPGDIVVSIHFPPPPERHAGIYIKLGRNALSDLAIVGVTALGFADQTTVSGYRFRLALASVAPMPLVPKQAEQILAQNPLEEATIMKAAAAAQDAANPISDPRGSSRYRKLMVKNLTKQAIEQVWDQLRSN
jgi:carbon-monoxide dehydrogenase medium subunit